MRFQFLYSGDSTIPWCLENCIPRSRQVPMACKLGQFGTSKCKNDVTVVLFSLDSASKEPRTLGIHRVMHSFSESHYPLPFVAYLPPNNDLSSFLSFFFFSNSAVHVHRNSKLRYTRREGVPRQVDISICRSGKNKSIRSLKLRPS